MLGEYFADFLRDTIAAVAGAGFGAWLGAKLAFRFARTQANADRQQATNLAAVELAERRATAGNLAIFALSQMYNDMLLFSRQLIGPAAKTNAPWFWMTPMRVGPDSYQTIDAASLAFLFQSSQPGAPIMPIKLKLEESRFRGLLETIRDRAEFHQENLVPIIARMMPGTARPSDLTDAQLRIAVGEWVYATLRNYYSDVEWRISRGIDSTQKVATELRNILISEVPGQTIIGFEAAKNIDVELSPLMKARNEFAERSDQPGTPS